VAGAVWWRMGRSQRVSACPQPVTHPVASSAAPAGSGGAVSSPTDALDFRVHAFRVERSATPVVSRGIQRGIASGRAKPCHEWSPAALELLVRACGYSSGTL
jgi:hypothetical protein